MNDPRLSLQLYSLRHEFEIDIESTLRSVPELGFDTIELAGDFGWNADRWKRMLEETGLSVSGAHIILERLELDLEGNAEFLLALGSNELIIPVPPRDFEGAQRYLDCAERMGRIAERAKELGCRLSYHNHDWEFEPHDDDANGRCGIDILLDETDPELISFEVDVAWMTAGGWDVPAFLRDHGDRVSTIHAKEIRAADRSEPRMGEGDVDFPTIVEVAVANNWPIVVEYESKNAPESVRWSAEYLNKLIADVRR